MGEIATNDRLITLYCQASSIRAKQTLAYAEAQGVTVLVIDLLKTRLSGSQLIEIANRLHLKVRDLVDQNLESFNSSLNQVELSTEDWIKMIHQNPAIMKQPIAIRGDQTILVNTPTDIIKI